MEIVQLSTTQEIVADKMKEIFMGRVTSLPNSGTWFKWVSTFMIADALNVNTDIVRNLLIKMEAATIVEANRSTANNTMWCLKDIPGFKQSRFTDSLERVEPLPICVAEGVISEKQFTDGEPTTDGDYLVIYKIMGKKLYGFVHIVNGINKDELDSAIATPISYSLLPKL